MKNSKSTRPLSIDAAIVAHKSAITVIESHMKPALKETTLVWVPDKYDLRTTSASPKIIKRVAELGGYDYYLDPENTTLCYVAQVAQIGERKYYLLGDRRIVRAKFCALAEEKSSPLPYVGEK